MTGALVILAVTVMAGFLLYITDVKYFRHHHSQAEENPTDVNSESVNEGNERDRPPKKESEVPEVCCGMHLVCEKTSLALPGDEIVYYDDEELDRFAGRSPQSYTSEETEEFRDVLMTLLPQDVVGWAKSMELRKIELPLEVKDELLLLVAEG